MNGSVFFVFFCFFFISVFFPPQCRPFQPTLRVNGAPSRGGSASFGSLTFDPTDSVLTCARGDLVDSSKSIQLSVAGVPLTPTINSLRVQCNRVPSCVVVPVATAVTVANQLAAVQATASAAVDGGRECIVKDVSIQRVRVVARAGGGVSRAVARRAERPLRGHGCLHLTESTLVWLPFLFHLR